MKRSQGIQKYNCMNIGKVEKKNKERWEKYSPIESSRLEGMTAPIMVRNPTRIQILNNKITRA